MISKFTSLCPVLLWAAFFPLPLFAEESEKPVRRAVVAGVDVYQDRTFMPLRGCANDAKSIAELLQTKFGFKPEEVILLTNEEVTLEKLRGAMKKHLVDELPANGVGVFYYAGHGVQMPDLDGDETDGWDEALVMTDTGELNPGSYLVDDEIHTILKSVKTPHLLALLDTCHSGTLNRTVGPYAEFRMTKIAWPATVQASRSATPHFALRGGPGHVVLSACQPDEVANELVGKNFTALGQPESTPPCGLFTWSLRKWLSDDENLTQPLESAVKKLEASVESTVTTTGKTQVQRAWHDLGDRGASNLASLLAGKATLTSAGNGGQQVAAPAAPQPITFSAEGVALEGGIPLELKLNQRVFKKGEKLVVEAKAEEDCFVRLYYMNVEGEVTQLFPNEYHQDNRLPKGKVVRVPGPGSGFDLEMGEPYGVEALKLVASDRQFSDLQDEKWAQGLFQQVDLSSLQEMNFRGVNTKQSDVRYGRATVFYKVLDPDAPATIAPAPTGEPAAPAGETPDKP